MAAYIAHDAHHASPRGILQQALNTIRFCSFGTTSPKLMLPSAARGPFWTFAENYSTYCAFFTQEVLDMGQAFFTDRDSLAQLPSLDRTKLEQLLKIYGNGFALRFIETGFAVRNRLPSGDLKQHTFLWTVDPELEISVPFALVAAKIVCNIKNCLKFVRETENAAFVQSSVQDSSLLRLQRGEAIGEPFLITMTAQPVTDRVWKLVTADNGSGITVEKLFSPLMRVAQRTPVVMSPLLLEACRKWSEGNAFAFNRIPYGDLLEAVFEFGVSAGLSGVEGGAHKSGLGLWGSLAMLIKLGAQVKVGVNPGAGRGFYEEVFLPANLSVTREEVAAVACKNWA